jgi:hypothetical protein
MKKIFTFFKATTLLLSLLLVSNNAQAQPGYICGLTMNPYISPFTFLSSGTRVTDIENASGTKSIPLGFTFKIGPCGSMASYTTVQVSSAGWMKFGTALGTANNDPGTSSAVFPGLWPFWGKTVNGVGGTATYSTDILPSGNRVFTMEWKDWRWDSLTYGTQYISFQVKLYEGTNIIEYAYKNGASTVSTGSSPYMAGLGISKTPTVITPYPCPGYNYAILQGFPTTPVLNRAGSYGPGLSATPADNQVLQFYQSCCSKPTAGFISQPDSVCPNAPFTAKVSGATPSPFPAYGVRYQWQSATSATGPWTNLSSTTTSQDFTSGIPKDTFLRVIVFCDSSGLTDTTPVKHVTMISLPYNCYCYSSETADINGVNIGNMKVITTGKDTLLNVGVGTPAFQNKTSFRPYTLNTGLRPIKDINRDSTYTLSVMGICKDTFAFSTSGVALYIDYNNDGVYDASTELAAFQVLSGTTTNFITTFTVPTTASLDTVGMRLVMKKGASSATTVPPCGPYSEGETEDYLINITYPKCPGPLLPGTAYITDTSICDGYTTTIWDTAHAKNMSQMHWQWEYSLDNVIWANVPGSKFMDTIQPVVRQSTYYRLRMVCEVTGDTIYSNKVFIKLKAAYKCYCYSLANGGNVSDSSDISTFVLDKFVSNTGGPHLNNPKSVRMRTDYTDLPAIELTSQERYPIAVYHTLLRRNHADARITVYMDFNHNLKYDAPSEIIWSRLSTLTDFYPHDTITIPVAVIPNVETGMRVVLNNDLGTNNPSDLGCDEMVSGEVEDYLVIFRKKTTGIQELMNVDNLQIYPNPNNGQFTVSFNALHPIDAATITVTNITGQQVYTEQLTNINNAFVKNINLNGQAAGVYFITLIADGQKSVNKLIVR